MQADTLRLLMWQECPKACPGCCNNDLDMDTYPYCIDYSPYKMVILTGGEPMLYPNLLIGTIRDIREDNQEAKIIVYTALVDNISQAASILTIVDGMTISIHHQDDVELVKKFLDRAKIEKKSMRLNIFEGIDYSSINTDGIVVKDNMVWIENCPIPENEILMRAIH